jgi:hypothetical protein
MLLMLRHPGSTNRIERGALSEESYRLTLLLAPLRNRPAHVVALRAIRGK